MSTQNHPTRRSFLRNTAIGTGSLFVPNLLLGQEGGTKKLNFAGVGCGGKGASDIAGAAKGANIVAFCDVDKKTLDGAKAKYPDAKIFANFRDMFDAMGDQIDGVTISTPDHAHFPAAMEAIKRGKHVCVQKPLVNRIWEANQLHEAAKKKGVKTNMGNQGHTGEGIRLLKEWINAGIVGNVKEVHVWTNRPIWPQGEAAKAGYKNAPVPDHLNWTDWQAATPEVPYIENIHPFKWRGNREYGAGAMGDMGCHILDGAFWSCELGEPYKMEAEAEELTDVTWSKSSHVLFHFKSPKFGEIKLHWYEGGRKPERPAELDAKRNWDGMKGGFFIRGESGVVLNTDDYCGHPELLGDADKFKKFVTDTPKTLERSLAPGEPQLELVKAIEENKICGSNFDYSVPLTKVCLFGNLAIANPGKVIEWDSATQQSNNADANKLLTRAAYRAGWEYSAAKI